MLRRHTRLTFAASVHFATTTVLERGAWFVDPQLCCRALEVVERYRKAYDLNCIGYCLMPDHFHILLHQEREGRAVSNLMERFKSMTSRLCVPVSYPDSKKFWRRRFDDMALPGSRAIRRRLTYIQKNPLRKGLAPTPQAYPWSSARDWFAGEQQGPITIWFAGLSP